MFIFLVPYDHDSYNVSGVWSKEEEEELTRIVQELTIEQGKNSDNDIFWGIVSQRMGNTRGRQQCRIKWLVLLSSIFLVYVNDCTAGPTH